MIRFWGEETLTSWNVHSKHLKDVTQIGTDDWTKNKRKAVI